MRFGTCLLLDEDTVSRRKRPRYRFKHIALSTFQLIEAKILGGSAAGGMPTARHFQAKLCKFFGVPDTSPVQTPGTKVPKILTWTGEDTHRRYLQVKSNLD